MMLQRLTNGLWLFLALQCVEMLWLTGCSVAAGDWGMMALWLTLAHVGIFTVWWTRPGRRRECRHVVEEILGRCGDGVPWMMWTRDGVNHQWTETCKVRCARCRRVVLVRVTFTRFQTWDEAHDEARGESEPDGQ